MRTKTTGRTTGIPLIIFRLFRPKHTILPIFCLKPPLSVTNLPFYSHFVLSQITPFPSDVAASVEEEFI